MSKKLKRILISVILIVGLLVGGFLIYVADYYEAEEDVLSILQNDELISVKDGYIELLPNKETDTAFIFYPGAKVEYLAYLPILDKIKQSNNIKCFLIEMPFNLAILNSNAANKIISSYPDIENWYIGGHSMGGAMASSFASKNQDKIEGLILMGAYIYGDYPEESTLTVYGTFNTSVAERINYTKNIVVIEGGNHAQFGNYGKQKGDPDATISTKEQQDITVKAINEFLKERAD